MTEYDRLAYINQPYPQTSPDHLAALGRLHGLNPPAVETARVLDLGTSEGGNLIPLAVALPDAEFVGIDLAGEPVKRGQAVIEALGLANIRLQQMNLLDLDAGFGKFDYIIAHGLYAWTPFEVRDKVLEAANANLSPDGIALVSYNTQPGGYMRKLVRDLMLFAAGEESEPAERLKAARAALDVAAAGCPDPDPVEQAVAHQARAALERTDSSLFHDYLAPVFEPVYFRDFMEHAARHGLDYVADASVGDTYNLKLSPAAMEAAQKGAGRISREQWLDFLRLRRFRSSLVCHAEAKPSAEWDARRAEGLYAASSSTRTGPAEFTGAGGIRATLESHAAEFVSRLIALWPRAEQVQARDAEMAIELFRHGMIELRSVPGRAAMAGARPVASPLVRYQAAQGEAQVSSLTHRALRVEDANGRKLLARLDGSRDRAALAREMGCPRDIMDAQLERLGRYAILLG